MYKYFYWLWDSVIFTLFRKIFGLLWYYMAVWFLPYSTNVVFNYSLQNNLFLKRLLERNPKYDKKIGGYILDGTWHKHDGVEPKVGFIKYRKISWIEYQLVYWMLWGWVDNDSNYDTMDCGYNDTILNGERMTWMPDFLLHQLRKETAEARLTPFGNRFDLGDRRVFVFKPLSSTLWLIRNTAYNFSYMTGETQDEYLVWYKKIGKAEFGWIKKQDFNNKPVFRSIFGMNW
jgi:hypothetical protein